MELLLHPFEIIVFSIPGSRRHDIYNGLTFTFFGESARAQLYIWRILLGVQYNHIYNVYFHVKNIYHTRMNIPVFEGETGKL